MVIPTCRPNSFGTFAQRWAKVADWNETAVIVDGGEVVTVRANDIRHGAALVLAAIGQTDVEVHVTNIEQIERGYADLPGQLNKICGNRILVVDD